MHRAVAPSSGNPTDPRLHDCRSGAINLGSSVLGASRTLLRLEHESHDRELDESRTMVKGGRPSAGLASWAVECGGKGGAAPAAPRRLPAAPRHCESRPIWCGASASAIATQKGSLALFAQGQLPTSTSRQHGLCLVRFDSSLLRGTCVPRQRESAAALRKQQPLRASVTLHGRRTR
jgi:hypothetical protein